MTAHRAGSRLAIFAFVVALLLKGAVPLFASAAAHLQGRNVAEICAVYGVALPAKTTATMSMAAAMPMAGHVHAHAHHAAGEPTAPSHAPASNEHGSDHCALGALVAFAATSSGAAAAAVPSASASGLAAPWRPAPRPADAAARWAARLGHGPPRFS